MVLLSLLKGKIYLVSVPFCEGRSQCLGHRCQPWDKFSCYSFSVHNQSIPRLSRWACTGQSLISWRICPISYAAISPQAHSSSRCAWGGFWFGRSFPSLGGCRWEHFPCPDAPFAPTCPEGIAGRLGGALCRASLERCETRRDVGVQASRFGQEEGLAERAVILRAGSAALLSPSQGCR